MMTERTCYFRLQQCCSVTPVRVGVGPRVKRRRRASSVCVLHSGLEEHASSVSIKSNTFLSWAVHTCPHMPNSALHLYASTASPDETCLYLPKLVIVCFYLSVMWTPVLSCLSSGFLTSLSGYMELNLRNHVKILTETMRPPPCLPFKPPNHNNRIQR